MSKKVSLGAALAMVIAAVTAAVAITMSVSQKVYNNIITDLPDRQKLYTAVAEIDELLRKEYYGNIEQEKQNSEIIEGYVRGLGDEYSSYLTASEYSDYKSRAEGTVSGIGVTVRWAPSEGGLLVASCAEGSPADVAGIAQGNAILKIEEEPVTADNWETLSEKLMGEKLTTVNITFSHAGTTDIVSVVKGYKSQAVTCSRYDETGVIRILDFHGNALEQLKSALASLENDGVKNLIIDLRGTNEGDVANAAAAADVFVPLATGSTGVMARAVDKNGVTVRNFTSAADEINMPVVILVNRETEGAAELFACTLRSFGKAQLVGTATRGKCTMQEVFELSNGGAVLLSVAEIVPYDGKSYETVGVIPDYEITLTDDGGDVGSSGMTEDIQMNKALEILTGQ